VNVIEDRAELLDVLPAQVTRVQTPGAAEFIAQRDWRPDEAIVIVSRNHELDRAALASALRVRGAGYIGMIGSRRKVGQVFAALRAAGVAEEVLKTVYAPIGIDIGADSPNEIAVSVVAEILAILRKTSARHLRSLGDNTGR
jgi:xanthine dehydrogenase accessory factor